jgi:membrane protein YdbS with pleckstrin-like domain
MIPNAPTTQSFSGSSSVTTMPSVQPRFLKGAYLAQGEQLLRETRATKWHFLPGPIAFLLILGILTLLDWANLSVLSNVNSALGGLHVYLLDLLLILVLIGVLWLLVRYLRWISTVYAITSHRIIVQAGIFSRDFDEIPIPQVRGVDVHQSVLQRMFGYGNLTISAEGGGVRHIGNEAWPGIPRPFDFQRLIESANLQLSRPVVRVS